MTSHMSKADREAAVRVLAQGVREISLPVNDRIANGAAVLTEDRNPFRGDMMFGISPSGQVHVIRAAALPGTNGQLAYWGPRSFPARFDGQVDYDGKRVVGTVETTVRRYNRFVVPGALVVGILFGLGVAVDRHHLWLTWPLWPVFTLLVMLPTYVTRRREAKLVLSDLERIAYLCVGQHAPTRIRYEGTGKYPRSTRSR